MSALLPRDATPTDLYELLHRLFPSYSTGIAAWTWGGETLSQWEAIILIEGAVHKGIGETPWMAWQMLKQNLATTPLWTRIQSEEALSFFEAPG